jgi:hypothetical protein
MSVQKSSKRFNLKLPPNIRAHFMEPYDAYLAYLLELTKGLTSFDSNMDQRLRDNLVCPTLSNQRWTLWVSRDIRSLFDQQKQILAPTRTHGCFVELLLVYRNHLESQNKLPVFVNTKRGFSTSLTTLDNSSNNLLDPVWSEDNKSLLSANLFKYPVEHPFSFHNQFGVRSELDKINLEQHLSLNDLSTSEKIQEARKAFLSQDALLPRTLHKFDSMLSQDSFLPTSTSYMNTPQSPTDPLTPVSRSRDDDELSEVKKKPRYSYEKANLSLMGDSFSTTLTNGLDIGIENLQLYSPWSEDFILSPDVLKATELEPIDNQAKKNIPNLVDPVATPLVPFDLLFPSSDTFFQDLNVVSNAS